MLIAEKRLGMQFPEEQEDDALGGSEASHPGGSRRGGGGGGSGAPGDGGDAHDGHGGGEISPDRASELRSFGQQALGITPSPSTRAVALIATSSEAVLLLSLLLDPGEDRDEKDVRQWLISKIIITALCTHQRVVLPVPIVEDCLGEGGPAEELSQEQQQEEGIVDQVHPSDDAKDADEANMDTEKQDEAERTVREGEDDHQSEEVVPHHEVLEAQAQAQAQAQEKEAVSDVDVKLKLKPDSLALLSKAIRRFPKKSEYYVRRFSIYVKKILARSDRKEGIGGGSVGIRGINCNERRRVSNVQIGDDVRLVASLPVRGKLRRGRHQKASQESQQEKHLKWAGMKVHSELSKYLRIATGEVSTAEFRIPTELSVGRHPQLVVHIFGADRTYLEPIDPIPS